MVMSYCRVLVEFDDGVIVKSVIAIWSEPSGTPADAQLALACVEAAVSNNRFVVVSLRMLLQSPPTPPW
jgi:hypothetical protein